MTKLGFIGAGNMAGALIKGLIAAKLYKPKDIIASDTVPAQLKKLAKAYNIEGSNDNRAVVRAAQTIILAVKPQILNQVLAEIQPEVTKDKLFISIAAGVTLRRLENGLGLDGKVRSETRKVLHRGLMKVAVAMAWLLQENQSGRDRR